MTRPLIVLLLALQLPAQGENWREVLPPPEPFRARLPDRRERLLDDEVRHAVARGQRWLVSTLGEDGSWATRKNRSSIELTAIAQLALLGNSTMRWGPHKNAVKRVAKWLKDQQRPSGAFVLDPARDFRGHAVAALAMAETAAVSNYKLLKKYSARGAAAIRAATPTQRALASGYDILALLTCHHWSERIETEPLAQLLRSSRRLDRPDASRAAALAILATNLADRPVGRDPELQPMAALLVADAVPRRRGADMRRDLEHDWWTGSALCLADATAFDNWYRVRRKELLDAQVTDGPAAGSWAPIDTAGVRGERSWQTALALLVLQVPARYARVK